jgi:uncharacterized tellurite resistance protein B-like protein
MQLDTPTIRRLRDRLLSAGGAPFERESHRPIAGLSLEQQACVDRVTPLAEVLFLTMAIDGARARSESAAIRNGIGLLADDLLPRHAIDRLLLDFDERLSEQGQEARLEAIASRFALNKPDAEAAFTLAAAIVLADGRVADAERTLMDRMRRYFGIPAERATALLDGAPTVR